MIKKVILAMMLTLILPYASTASVTFSTYNIRTFDKSQSYTNKQELKNILTKLRTDFLVVQEIVNTSSFLEFIKKEFPHYKAVLSNCGGRGRQKIGFVYHKEKFKLKKLYEDRRLSHLSSIKIKTGCGRLRPALVGEFVQLKTNNSFVAIGLHLKAGGTLKSYRERAKQYKILARIVHELKTTNHKDILILGDFNSTGFIDFDEDYKNFDYMLKKVQMNSSSEGLRCTSYWTGKNRRDGIEESSVLDHILYENSFLNNLKIRVKLSSHCKKVLCEHVHSRELGVSYSEVSDHCPVSIVFE